MFNYFPSLGGKGKEVQGFFKNSITLLGRDIDIFKPVVYSNFSQPLTCKYTWQTESAMISKTPCFAELDLESLFSSFRFLLGEGDLLKM
jgi:hypothetical protein